MVAVLKVKYEGQVHRLILPDKELVYQDIQDALRALHLEETAVVKYLDDEKDLCTLCPSSFADFLSFAQEQGGRTILRLELVARKPSSVPSSAQHAEKTEHNPERNDNPFAAMLKAGFGMLSTLAQKGKGGLCGNNEGWQGGRMGKMKQLKFLLIQLHKNGALTSKTAASLAVSILPDFLAHVVEHSEQIDSMAKDKLNELRPALDDLCELMKRTDGLSHCVHQFEDFLKSGGTSSSEALLGLLAALDDFSFESKIAFFEAFYKNQEQRLKTAFAKFEESAPWFATLTFPLVHQGITCDGCGKSPVNGLRFKCKECPDYDLCGDCFADKTSIHTGDCLAHQFERIRLFPGAAWMAGCKGKGKGKNSAKGKCKGKCRGSSNLDIAHETDEKEDVNARACPGCGFAVTWHPTHCCEACRRFGNNKHGPRCERRPFRLPETAASPEADSGIEVVQEKIFDFSFPVVVEDGRHLTISWNKDDDSKKVAQSFAQQHGILHDELSTIQEFVQHAALQCAITGQTEHKVCKEAEDEAEEHALREAQKIAEGKVQQDEQAHKEEATEDELQEAGQHAPEEAEQKAQCDADEHTHKQAEEQMPAAAEGKAEQKADELLKEEKMMQAQRQLEEMGFGLGSEVLGDLLQKHGGSVERVIEALCCSD